MTTTVSQRVQILVPSSVMMHLLIFTRYIHLSRILQVRRSLNSLKTFYFSPLPAFATIVIFIVVLLNFLEACLFASSTSYSLNV